jgi:hypothetical protein
MSRLSVELALTVISFLGVGAAPLVMAADAGSSPPSAPSPAPVLVPSPTPPAPVAPAAGAPTAVKPTPRPESAGPPAPEQARKPSAADKREARKHFARALELIEDGQLAGALLEFQRSYELKPHFAVLYNIGMAHTYLGQPVEAADALERYLAEGGSAIKARRRKEVTTEIEWQKARIAMLTIAATPAEATLKVDGQAVAAAAASTGLRVAIGEHVIAASADGYEPAETRVTVAAGDRRAISLVLAKPAPPPPAEPAVAAVAPPPPPPAAFLLAPPAQDEPPPAATVVQARPPTHGGMRATGLVVGGAGVAAAAVGLGLLFKSRSLHDDALGHCQPNCDGEAQHLQSRADKYMLATNVLFIGGGVAVLSGAALYFFAWRADRAGASVAVAPVLVPGLAALAAQGSW